MVKRIDTPKAAAAAVGVRHPPGPADDGGALAGLEYVVVDVETTGGSARRGHRVTEIAAIRVDAAGRVLDELCTLVDPERPIPPWITRLTTITDEMVRGAPRFAELAPRLREMLEGRVFVAHNASFDWGFVRAELERARAVEPSEMRRLCTVRLARRLVPEVERRSLDVLADFFGIENEARHRAYGDARATAIVLRRLLERLEEREIRSWAGVELLLASRRARRRAAEAARSVATGHGTER